MLKCIMKSVRRKNKKIESKEYMKKMEANHPRRPYKDRKKRKSKGERGKRKKKQNRLGRRKRGTILRQTKIKGLSLEAPPIRVLFQSLQHAHSINK